MSNYWLIGGAVTLGLLLIASVLVAIMQNESEFAAGSPEAVVQDYLHALEEDDLQAVYDTFSPELQSKCSIEDMFRSYRSASWRRLHESQITLEGARMLDATTLVTVRIARLRGGDLFGPSEYAFEETFVLKQFDGEWNLSQDPWPHFRCARSTPTPPPATIGAP